MPPVSAEATVSRNYIDWLVSVPWKKKSREIKDLDRAQKILDEDHFGLDEIKERILEFLAVRQLANQTQSSIICFVGPPGVGKSSLAKSIARAMGRKFVRLSLGGVRDEAEIRGHRRTYIGAFPGQIIQMMRKAGTVNPVFLLDEIDKMSTDFRGDPSSALMEVLDPEQNNAFKDHYMDAEFDLSKVMFIATANVSHTIPGPLRDRMEVIHLSGYTMTEKLAIAQGFLIPKQAKAHGLSKGKIQFFEDGLRKLIENYTREAGVRNLERQIAKVCRKVVREIVQKKKKGKAKVTDETVIEYLGKEKFRRYKFGDKAEVGVSMGLAWTEAGGELLETEVGLMKGRGKLILTGQLGDVMKESARAAVSYLRSRADLLGVDPDFNEGKDLHIHVPEGAIPKDGPSAGITMATALVSAATGLPVRRGLAMTGEITLRGKVLPIGGVKHKLLAAYRADIKEVILPKENERDLDEIPDEVRQDLEVHLVETMDEVLALALEGEIRPLPGAEASLKETPANPKPGSVAH
jgi:ATP-dependent Lon protease